MICRVLPVGVVSLGLICVGCGQSEQKPGGSSAGATAASADAGQPKKREFKPVEIGGAAGEAKPTKILTAEEMQQNIREALKPLQVMVGQWKGITNSKKSYEELEWVWDFKTDRKHPSLAMSSEKGAYVRTARLTWLPQDQQFQMTVVSPEGQERLLEGKFTAEPEVITGDDGKPQKTHKLLLTQVSPAEGDQWQVVFNQQESNRYILELSRKRADGEFSRLDTVGTQRMGTSFAVNDEDYGERKCVISGGLGTSTVSFDGKTYWVCCSGCKAAFEENPQFWIAKLKAMPAAE